MNNNNTIDIWLKKSASKGNVSFNENDWDEMKRLLQKKKKRRFLFWWLLSFIVISFLLIDGLHIYKKNDKTNFSKETYINQVNKKQKDTISKTPKKVNKSANAIVDNDKILDNLKNVVQSSIIDSNYTKNTNKNAKNKAIYVNTLGLKNSATKITNEKIKKENRKAKRLFNIDESIEIFEKIVTRKNSGKKKITVKAAVSKVDKNSVEDDDFSIDSSAIINSKAKASITITPATLESKDTIINTSTVKAGTNNNPIDKPLNNNKKKKVTSFFYAGVFAGTNHPLSNKINPNITLSYHQKITDKFYIGTGFDINQIYNLRQQQHFQVVAKTRFAGTTLWRIDTKNTLININKAIGFSPFLIFQYQNKRIGLGAGIQQQQIFLQKIKITNQQDSLFVQGTDADKYIVNSSYNNKDFIGKKNNYLIWNVSYTIKNKFVLGINGKYLLSTNNIVDIEADKLKKLLFNLSFGIKF
jgi:hypothetical protein